ncbi:helix-turn-helix domain-containing protein [Vibrio mexicanus]|uniref:helix-turn-helix domain-containing protein n=1 Tax=Vibrio mexicanus TaxID=1004326 RepID=UPI00063C8DA8|nr:AraC family transcriptional regulator [Vibrio mexicanus]
MITKEIQTYPDQLQLTAYRKVRPELTFHWHYHWDWEITLTTNVQGERYIADDICEVSGWDLTLTRPGVAHTWGGRARHTAVMPTETDQQDGMIHSYIVMVPSNWFTQLAQSQLTELVELQSYFERCPGAWSYHPTCMTKAYPIIQQLCEGRSAVTRFSLFLLLLELLRSEAPNYTIALSHKSIPQLEDSRMLDALSYMTEHYHNAITLEETARYANLSIATLKRHFKQSMQSSFSQYLQHLRLGHASHLLKQTSKPIDVIANQAGYANLSLFHRHFKKHRGVTPNQYRKQVNLNHVNYVKGR